MESASDPRTIDHMTFSEVEDAGLSGHHESLGQSKIIGCENAR